jgi:hypothetical protein
VQAVARSGFMERKPTNLRRLAVNEGLRWFYSDLRGVLEQDTELGRRALEHAEAHAERIRARGKPVPDGSTAPKDLGHNPAYPPVSRTFAPLETPIYAHVQNAPAQGLARKLKEAEGGPMPAFIAPALTTLVARPPSGPWLHETKFDGRFQAHITKGGLLHPAWARLERHSSEAGHCGSAPRPLCRHHRRRSGGRGRGRPHRFQRARA